MTFQAARFVIGDLLLDMFIVEFGFVMAQEAIGRTAVAIGVAGGAFTVGLAMIHGERMVEISRFPAISAVTGGTLALKVIGWAGMAALAVGCPGQDMVEVGRLPGRGGMAS